LGTNSPFVLRIARPSGILELHGTSMEDWQLGVETVGKAQERRRQRQACRSGRCGWKASLFIGEIIGLEGIQLDALGLDIPSAELQIVITSDPGQARRGTPVRVFSKCRTTNTKIATASSEPSCRRDQQSTILVYVQES